jgi:membrane protein DedA with SNARE-associated domain
MIEWSLMFDWILNIIETGGYAGIFALMVLENIFPPIPSELVIPLSGYAAAEGDMNIAIVILVASLGAVVGALPWYYLGKAFGIERLKRMSVRYGRWLTLTPADIDAAQAWFDRHGHKTVLLGRLVPTVRTLISLPAGMARMPLLPFLLYYRRRWRHLVRVAP